MIGNKRQRYEDATAKVDDIEAMIGRLEQTIRDMVRDFGDHYPGRSDHEVNLGMARENLTAARQEKEAAERPYLEEERVRIQGLIDSNRDAMVKARAERSAVDARIRELGAEDSDLSYRIVKVSTRLQALNKTRKRINVLT